MFEKYLNQFNEVGYVSKVIPPLCYVDGLPNANFGELVYFENGVLGQVQSINDESIEILLLTATVMDMGARVARSGSSISMKFHDGLYGQVINPLGHYLSSGESPDGKDTVEIVVDLYKEQTAISNRVKITQPFETGVPLVDLLIPLGKGQRELIVGDRKTGKSAFLLQCLLKQALEGTFCIYACIGKKKADIKHVENYIKKHNIGDKCLILAASSSDPPGLQYIAPYTAMSLAEHINEKGSNVLLILDDLSTHAKIYREISLLGSKFPGRNSYPADIFFAHARLLERAGNFKHHDGEHSITCLPVAETLEGEISGYIETNIMSITDGHIFFDREMFAQGRRPSINHFLSVTRVGRQTQTPLRWSVNREINSFLNLLNRTESFMHFGAELNEGIQSTLSMGSLILSFFNQPADRTISSNLQLYLFGLIWLGTWNGKDKGVVRTQLERIIHKYIDSADYRIKIDALVGSCADLNSMLGKLSTNLDVHVADFAKE